MKCETIKEILAAYLDKEVTPEERRQVQDHLSGCKQCQEELKALTTTREAVRQAFDLRADGVSPSPESWEKLRQRLDATPRLSLWEHLRQPVWRTVTATMLVIALAFGALWGTGIIPGLFGVKEVPTPTSPIPSRIGGGGEASWAFYFDNLADLCAYSDVIAVGEVDRVVEIVVHINVNEMLYSTRWALRVEQVLKGKETGELIINQTGAPNQPGSDIRDDPLFLPGERYLLFLREGTPGIYFSFGPLGRYMVWNNKVYSMNYILLPEAGYHAPPELDFDGVALDTLVGDIVELVDSVQLTFIQYAPRLRADILRYPAGTTLTIDATLSSGKYGPGKVTFTINRDALPEGLEVSIRPAEFTAYPRSEYKSTLIISTAPDLSPGTYEISIEYNFNGVGSGHRTITLHVESQ
jgi:hypothetical protein